MITLSLLISLLGLILYFVFTVYPNRLPIAETGRIMFFAGLLAYLLGAGTKAIL